MVWLEYIDPRAAWTRVAHDDGTAAVDARRGAAQ
jgi:hypothetical protein